MAGCPTKKTDLENGDGDVDGEILDDAVADGKDAGVKKKKNKKKKAAGGGQNIETTKNGESKEDDIDAILKQINEQTGEKVISSIK